MKIFSKMLVVLLMAGFFQSIYAEEKLDTPAEKSEIQSDLPAVESQYYPTDEFVPHRVQSGFSYNYQSSYSYHSRKNSPACLSLLRQKYGQGYIATDEAVSKASVDQTRTQGLLAIGYGAVTGTALGFATGNPVLGVGWGLGSMIFGGIGQSIERGRIQKNGLTVSASEKILAGVELTEKEQKAFEKSRKKVSKKAYKNKNAIGDVDFAQTVLANANLNEQLFCDIDKNGNLKILPQNRKTIKRLVAAQKCKDSQNGKIPSREKFIQRSTARK